MKKYVVLDQLQFDWFEEILETESREEAIEMAEAMWNRLTKSDQNKRTHFALVFGEVDEEGVFDYEAGFDDVVVFK